MAVNSYCGGAAPVHCRDDEVHRSSFTGHVLSEDDCSESSDDEASADEDKELVDGDVHHAICDSCDVMSFRGKRFRSQVVEDFDLCAVCKNGGAFDISHGPFFVFQSQSEFASAKAAATAK